MIETKMMTLILVLYAELHTFSFSLACEICDFPLRGHNQGARQEVLSLIFPAV